MRSLGRGLLFPLLAAGHPSSGGAPRCGEEPFPPIVQSGTFLATIGDSFPDRHAILAAVHNGIGDAYLRDSLQDGATADRSSTICFGHQLSYLNNDMTWPATSITASSTSTWSSSSWGATTASSATPPSKGWHSASRRYSLTPTVILPVATTCSRSGGFSPTAANLLHAMPYQLSMSHGPASQSTSTNNTTPLQPYTNSPRLDLRPAIATATMLTRTWHALVSTTLTPSAGLAAPPQDLLLEGEAAEHSSTSSYGYQLCFPNNDMILSLIHI